MNDYGTTNWAQKILLAIVLGGILSFVAAVAFAREPPQAHCSRFTANQIRCEAHNVEPYTPLWLTTSGSRLLQEQYGIVVFLTLDSEWRTIHMVIAQDGNAFEYVTIEARIWYDTPQFRPIKGTVKEEK